MIVLDANILIRAVLGSKVMALLRKHAGLVEFFSPDTAFHDVREHLPRILERRGISPDPAVEALDLVERLVQRLDPERYLPYETIARERIERRDEADRTVLASALALDCPIWTEDTDFFGCGVATWTTDRVELYLSQVSARKD